MSTTSTFREGWLYKLSWINIHRTWKKRYFVLNGDELRYYKQPEDSKPAGTIDLRHYCNVKLHPMKQSSWAFRMESGFRQHWNQHLYAESTTDSKLWIESIQEQLKQLLSQPRGNPGFPLSVINDDSETSNASISPMATTADDDSVLDRWLERLDLQEEKPLRPTSTLASSASSSTDEEGRELVSSPLPLIRPHCPKSLASLGYQSTDSLDTMVTNGPPSLFSSDMSSYSSATAAVSGPVPGVSGANSTSMLANADAQTKMVKRRTTISDRLCCNSGDRTASSIRSSPPLSLDTDLRRYPGIERLSATYMFHSERGDSAAPHLTRYSVESIPPRRLPPPTSPLPPLPQQESMTTTSAAASPSSAINKQFRYNTPGRRFSAQSSVRY